MKLSISSAVHQHHLPGPQAAFIGEYALIDGLRRGDDQSYAELVSAHGGRLLKIARRYLGEDEARDAVQETFLIVFESIQGFRAEAGLSTWLHRIVINCCMTRLRKPGRSREFPIDEVLPAYLQDGHRANPAPAWPLGVDELMARNELQQLVRDLIKQLPEPYRRVLMLRDIEGFSCAETAQLLEISVAAVKMRLHRARQVMRELLEPHIGAKDHVV